LIDEDGLCGMTFDLPPSLCANDKLVLFHYEALAT
jgi:hypothetical protein